MLTTAKIISERTAGGLWIEIWVSQNEKDYLVFSHDYFESGATERQYRERLEQAKNDAEACLGWAEWEGCNRDSDSAIVCPSDGLTTYVVAEFARCDRAHAGIWSVECNPNDALGVARDFLESLGVNCGTVTESEIPTEPCNEIPLPPCEGPLADVL